MFRPIFSTVIIVLFFLIGPAMAEDITGTVTGNFDGKDMQWYVTAKDGRSQSDWTDMGPLANINIFAHPTDDTIAATKGALLIGFKVFNLASSPAVATPEITYMQDGYTGMFGSRDGATITIEVASIKDDKIHMVGTFEGEVYYSTDHLRTLDTANPKTILGRFDVTLSPTLQ